MDWLIVLLILGFVFYIVYMSVKDAGRNEKAKAGAKKVVIVGGPRGQTGERPGIQGDFSMSNSESEAIVSLLNSMNQLLDEIGAARIESPEQVFSNMSKDLRTKVAPFIYPPFGEGTGNLINLKLEAITKAAEIHYRLTLYKEQSLASHGKLAILSKIAPENLRVLLDGVVGMQRIHGERSDKLEGPFEKLAEHLIAAVSYDYAIKMIESLDKDRSNPEFLEMVKNISFLPASAVEGERMIKVDGEIIDEDYEETVNQRGNGRGGRQ